MVRGARVTYAGADAIESRADVSARSADLPDQGPGPTAARVAVVIVDYNAGETLLGCLDALRPIGNHVSVTVVDNASIDGSAGLVRPPADLIEAAENLGFGRASNLGFARTGAPYVLFLNPDAVIQRADVLRLAAVLDGEPAIAAAGPRIVDEQGTRDPHCARREPTVLAFLFQVTGLARSRPASPLFGTFFDRGTGTRDVACLSGACMLVRRDAIEDGPPFDERFFIFGEDLDLCLRLGRAGHRVRYVDDVTCVHVGGHSMGQVVPNAVMEGYRSWVLLLAKDRGRLSGALAWLVAVAAALSQLPVWVVGSLLAGAGSRRAARARARGCLYILGWAFGLRKGGVPW